MKPGVIVWERGDILLARLRPALVERRIPVTHPADIRTCVAALDRWPTAAVVAEASDESIETLLDLLVLSHRRFPTARILVVTRRELAGYEPLLRELGAAHIETSPRDLRRVITVIERHRASLVRFESTTNLIPDPLPELPWGLKLKLEDFAPAPADPTTAPP